MSFLVSSGTGLTLIYQDVAMILLQILDEGQLTDSHGRKVDFKVSIDLSPVSSSDRGNRTQLFVSPLTLAPTS